MQQSQCDKPKTLSEALEQQSGLSPLAQQWEKNPEAQELGGRLARALKRGKVVGQVPESTSSVLPLLP